MLRTMIPEAYLSAEGRIGTQKQLLPGLPAGIEGARDLRATKGTVGEKAAVFAGERHALGNTLVDDVHTHLGKPIDVGLARAVVAPFHRVVEKPVDAVTVVLVVLGGVDAALCGDAVGPARTVLIAETGDVIALLRQARRRRAPGEPGADHDDVVFAPVRRVHQLHFEFVVRPLVLDGTVWNFWI